MTSRKDDPITQEWTHRAKNLIKGELRRRGLTYADLVASLANLGVQETERNLINKLSRGGFSAAFLMQCLAAMEVKSLHFD